MDIKFIVSKKAKLIGIVLIGIIILLCSLGTIYFYTQKKTDNKEQEFKIGEQEQEGQQQKSGSYISNHDFEENDNEENSMADEAIKNFQGFFKESAEDTEQEAFWQAARALKAVRNKALPQLMNILADKDTNAIIRVSLFGFILSDMEDQRIVPTLMEIIADKTDNQFLRKEAIRLLGKISEKTKNAEVLNLLLNIAKDQNEDYEVREYAVWNLGRVGDKTSVSYIIELTYEDDRTFKVPAILALGEVNSILAVDRLIELLDSNNKEDISLAAKSLQEANDARAIKPLINALEKNINDTNKRAVTIDSVMNALGSLKTREAVPVLIKILNGEDGLSALVAAENLGKIGDERAIKPLKEAFERETDSYGLNKISEAYKSITGLDLQ